MRAWTFIRRLSALFVSEQSHVKCFPFKGGVALTDDRLVSGVSGSLKSLVTLVEVGNSAATKSGVLGVIAGSSVIDAKGGARDVGLAFFACKASCNVCSL